ncbi:hypothetical protein TH25_20035 [Thalassospira profundimaris]|uniref:DUF1413 domain-containing protein n=1 Tax=Thalassospira profundimaris TaxID=502049 RepID=A0A367WRV0_9PROT|nr:DUF1413 domain-containing protein [Thalassospira profundimaris]RCK44196.1 hypothetical protein TH25_20035 [Thalassospira profundimaris]
MTEDDIRRLQQNIARHPARTFHFPEIYGNGWDDLYIGDKVQMGHQFLDAVRAGNFPGVADTGTKKDGGRVYQKTDSL